MNWDWIRVVNCRTWSSGSSAGTRCWAPARTGPPRSRRGWRCAAVPDLTKPLDEQGRHPLCPPTAQHAMRQAKAAARNIAADVSGGSRKPYRQHDLGLVVDLGRQDAAVTPMGVLLGGRPAKAVTTGYEMAPPPRARPTRRRG